MEITQYNPVRAEIAALREQNASLVFIYTEKAGNKNARSHIAKLRTKKADVERVRKAAKAEFLEAGRRVDTVADELKDALDIMIDFHQKPIEEIEKAEREAKEAKEKAEADAKAEVERIEREKQEAALAAERAEAAKVKADMEAMRKKIHEDRIAREASDKARAEAEEKSRAEREAAVQRAKDDAERKHREEAEAVELRRIAKRAEEAERIRNKKVRAEIIQEIAESIIASVVIGPEVAQLLAELMLDGKIARVTANTEAGPVQKNKIPKSPVPDGCLPSRR